VNAEDEIGCSEAERALIGCLLLGHAPTVRDVLVRLRPEDLSDPRLRTVVAAVRAVMEAGYLPDPVLVVGELRRSGADKSFLADRSCAVLLADLAAAPASVGSAGAYLLVVLEHAWRRRVDEAGVRLQQVAGTQSLATLEEVVVNELRALGAYAGRWRQQPPSPLRSVGGAA